MTTPEPNERCQRLEMWRLIISATIRGRRNHLKRQMERLDKCGENCKLRVEAQDEILSDIEREIAMQDAILEGGLQ
jgi:hypothetical protein